MPLDIQVLKQTQVHNRHLLSSAGDEIKISVEVHNAGKRAGDEVVQLYVKDLAASTPSPLRALQGFKRIHLKPGEKSVVEFILQPKQLASINEMNPFVVESGGFKIAVGGALPGAAAARTATLAKQISD